MSELEDWFEKLGSAAGVDTPAPSADEVRLLLDIGKKAAEAAPQRYFALLTAYWAGRSGADLGRVLEVLETY